MRMQAPQAARAGGEWRGGSRSSKLALLLASGSFTAAAAAFTRCPFVCRRVITLSLRIFRSFTISLIFRSITVSLVLISAAVRLALLLRGMSNTPRQRARARTLPSSLLSPFLPFGFSAFFSSFLGRGLGLAKSTFTAGGGGGGRGGEEETADTRRRARALRCWRRSPPCLGSG